MKALITLIAILFIATSCAPKLSTHGHYNSKPKKSEARQRNFITAWTVTGIVIIAWTLQSQQEDKKHK